MQSNQCDTPMLTKRKTKNTWSIISKKIKSASIHAKNSHQSGLEENI